MVRKHSLIRLAVRLSGVAALYFLIGRAGMLATTDGSLVTPIWPASGFALVAVLIGGYPMALGIAIGSFFVNLSVGLSPLVSALIAAGNNIEYLGGAFLLRRQAEFHLGLERPQDVTALMFLGAGLATTFSAVPGLAVLILGDVESPAHVGWLFLRWWQAGMVGVLIVPPLLLVWLQTPRSRLTMAQTLEAGALLLMLLLVWSLIFDISTPSGHGYYPAILAVFPFTIWGALRFGLRGATLVNLITTSLGVWGTAQGSGPFAGDSPSDNLVRWCLFTNAVAMTGLYLASASAEKRRAQLALQESHAELERKVQERTAALLEINEGLKREAAERKRLEAELLQADEDHQRRFGMELHDGLGQHLTSIAFFGATLRQQLEQQQRPEAKAARRIETLLNEAIDMVRALARGLFPASLSSDGLPAALRQLAESTHALERVSCDFHAASTTTVDDPPGSHQPVPHCPGSRQQRHQAWKRRACTHRPGHGRRPAPTDDPRRWHRLRPGPAHPLRRGAGRRRHGVAQPLLPGQPARWKPAYRESTGGHHRHRPVPCAERVMTAETMATKHILIVDDHPIVREGIASFLSLQGGLDPCCGASTTEEALKAMTTCHHDLAIVDISLDGGSGLELIKTLRNHDPQLAILALSMHDESLFAERALRAGANGYLMKQEATRNVLLAVRQVLAGNVYLSPAMHERLAMNLISPGRSSANPAISALSEREFEVLHLIGLGFGTRQIAERLNRSVKTIEAHRAGLKKKLQMDSGRDLERFAMQLVSG